MKIAYPAILLLICCSASLRAQEQESSITVNVDLVNVLCNVYDKQGLLVKDLAAKDFEVLENGKKQEIRYFTRETDLPVTIALLVDVSGSVRWVIDQEKEAAGRFLEAILRPDDRAMLIGFSSTLILWQDFTPSTVQLRVALNRLRPVPFHGAPVWPMPGTLLYDGVFMAASTKMNDIAGRKVMVIISDGLDNGSQAKLDAAVSAVQTTNTIVYSICYEGGFSGCSYLKNISEPTGGRMFKVNKKITLSQIFQTIEDEMRNQYAIGYVPVNREHDGTFRKLQVKVRGASKVQARKGYYAVRDKQP